MDVKVLLEKKDTPRQWYTRGAAPPPPLHPPLGPDGHNRGEESLRPARIARRI